jgi:poly-gamma-glutamate synthesis protein (capsule biosynthesis protein)
MKRRRFVQSLATTPLLTALPGCNLPQRSAGTQIPVPPLTRLLLGGDVMLSRYVETLARRKKDAAWPFRHLAPILSAADIAFVNLESPFSDRRPIADSPMIFRAGGEMIEGLKLAGIDVVSTANNHARDCGSYGVGYTLDWLRRHGIAAVGSAESAAAVRNGVVLERNGVRFGFLAYTYDQSNGNHPSPDERIAVLEVDLMREDVRRLRRGADVVIVSMHAGDEYRTEQNPQQVEFAHAAIDAGATVVAGHHPHVTQPVEEYNGGVIFYSLGNLIFDQFHRKETQEGLLAEVTYRGTAFENYRLAPVEIRDTVPRLVQGARDGFQIAKMSESVPAWLP